LEIFEAKSVRPGGIVFLAQMLLCVSGVGSAQQDYTIDTVAGYVPNRENESAIEAVLVNPTASAIDAAGNLYFFDSSPGRIRTVCGFEEANRRVRAVLAI